MRDANVCTIFSISFSFFRLFAMLLFDYSRQRRFGSERKDEQTETYINFDGCCIWPRVRFFVGAVNLLVFRWFLGRVDAFEYSILLRPTYSYSQSNSNIFEAHAYAKSSCRHLHTWNLFAWTSGTHAIRLVKHSSERLINYDLAWMFCCEVIFPSLLSASSRCAAATAVSAFTQPKK